MMHIIVEGIQDYIIWKIFNEMAENAGPLYWCAHSNCLIVTVFLKGSIYKYVKFLLMLLYYCS